MRRDKYTKNKEIILEYVKSHNVFTLDHISTMLEDLKNQNLVQQSITSDSFYFKLLEDGLISYTISLRDIQKTRYSLNKEFNIYDFASSLENKSFFPMFTSLNIQGLSNYRNNFVFISKERKERNNFASRILTQDAIDKAFASSPRRTKAHDVINGYNVVSLESNNTGSIGIIDYNGYKVSSINRALVEIISNIHYFVSPDNVISEFKAIKDKLNINEIFKIIEKFDFIYPYYQLAGYYLEKIGFTKNELIKFYSKKGELIFYTIKNKEEYKLDTYWNIKY